MSPKTKRIAKKKTVSPKEKTNTVNTHKPLSKMEKFSTEDDSETIEVVRTSHGGPKVIHENYIYTLHRKQLTKLRWSCVNKKTRCNGAVITTEDFKKSKLIQPHNHEPNLTAVEIARQRFINAGKPAITKDIWLTKGSGHSRRSDITASGVWRVENSPQRQSHRKLFTDAELYQDGASLNKEIYYEDQYLNTRHFLQLLQCEPGAEEEERLPAMLVEVLPNPTQTSSDNYHKSIRIGQSLIRPRTIAPAPLQLQSQQPQPSQQQPHHPQQQQQQQQPQQQPHPKTLVLKTLKVKHVAPTTIKMPPRQTSVAAPQVIIPQQPTEVCLRWNSYHSNMQNSFPSLLDSEQFVDVTLACEGRSLKCHKMILSSCSDYLADLLRENPCQHPIILMKDLKFWEVEALVKFMYRGEVNVAHDKLPQLLNAAEALQVKGLAGPSPSTQSSKPPMLIPQPTKLSTAQPVITRISAETKETKNQLPSTSNPTTTTKRAQKRPPSEPNDRPFTKIRLQRPASPSSPTVTVKLEPLDIPLSPTEIFPDRGENRSSSTNYENPLEEFREEEDAEGDPGHNSIDRELNFCEIPGHPDLNDNEEQMEFVPSDFLEQEQDILDDHEEKHKHDTDGGGQNDDDLNVLNTRHETPGRNRIHDIDLDDDDDCEFSEKLSEENNGT